MRRLTKVGSALLAVGALTLPLGFVVPAQATDPATPCSIEVFEKETARFAFTCTSPSAGQSYQFVTASNYGGDWQQGGDRLKSSGASSTALTDVSATDNGDGTTTYVTEEAMDLSTHYPIGREPVANPLLGDPWLYASAVMLEAGNSWTKTEYLNRAVGTQATAFNEFFETTTARSTAFVEPNSTVHVNAFDAVGRPYFDEYDTIAGADGKLALRTSGGGRARRVMVGG
ncbi:hypothetical protein DWB68_15665 [Galactobacter valiniphilus]|uniref:Uncharacterized protein n=1 Tax=Galactobacter valiniphilus TaxID=2676122 RepID=A0A399JA33_9MICC|nr:hypothetical protein [Galactobacter valiniphilus]RII40872.1 hypothetical protein DWB68_15665 [Galactobacter valiniphilus]